ncbi:MAG: hypothetical protein CO071_01860 [Gallionellales bacterium CG_4_9_14_0_8_um_filter_59_50]|nr:MAG: hypothetical protein CO071_01860 [Gallionellales bacterium CG_4_9_14_0_8_um_filter_59_50]
MKPLRLWAVLCLICTLVGCGIGGFWMTGDPSAGKDIKPYIAYWQKDGVTEEERLADWVACGGNENGTFSWKVKEQFSGESDEQTRTRQSFDFQRCVLRAGYRYTGNCSSDWAKTQPYCGAP